jgi:hypothetical protein
MSTNIVFFDNDTTCQVEISDEQYMQGNLLFISEMMKFGRQLEIERGIDIIRLPEDNES